MLDAEWMKGLDEREAKLGNTRFYFDKMGAVEGFRVFEMIRAEMANTKIEGTGVQDGDFMRIVAALDPDFVERLRERLFNHVRFTTPNNSPIKLAGAEDMAFDGLEPVHIYEVLARALAVNFIASFRELSSRTGAAVT